MPFCKAVFMFTFYCFFLNTEHLPISQVEKPLYYLLIWCCDCWLKSRFQSCFHFERLLSMCKSPNMSTKGREKWHVKAWNEICWYQQKPWWKALGYCEAAGKYNISAVHLSITIIFKLSACVRADGHDTKGQSGVFFAWLYVCLKGVESCKSMHTQTPLHFLFTALVKHWRHENETRLY